MRRVVVTGMGIISSIGNSLDEVTQSLKEGRSGIAFNQTYADMGFRSHVSGSLKIDLDEAMDRKERRFMGDGAAYNYLAMKQAIADAGLSEKEVSNPRSGLIMGSGGPSTRSIVEAADITRKAPFPWTGRIDACSADARSNCRTQSAIRPRPCRTSIASA